MKKEIEILAPAGSMESLKAAVAAGADAVYLGGERFGARAYADNFSGERMLEAIDYAHLHGVQIYLTVNTLLKEKELTEELYAYLLPLYRHGLDAVIVQDIGVFRFVRRHFPDLAVHASTQMTIAGVDGARFLEREGAARVVTARELTLPEIRRIADETDLEIESFVHGALCYCYSGQCLFSSFLGGRSGNRGQCAQPCRLKYKAEGAKEAEYLLSPKDICTLELIPRLVEAGIFSFKIEGRMKKPEYVAGVVSMYRKYTDLYLRLKKERGAEAAGKVFRVEKADLEKLMDLYNRGGSCTGYYERWNGPEMISRTRPNHAGVPAVRVEGKQGRRMTGKALTELHPGDVLEIPARKGKERPDNYTCKELHKKGETVQVPVFADTPLPKGGILMRTRNEELIAELHREYLEKKCQEPVKGRFYLREGEPARLVVSFGNEKAEVLGEAPQKAQNRPMDAERVEKQLKKTGNSPFYFEALEVEMDEGLFFPMQSINEMRRQALEGLERAIVEAYRRGEAVRPGGTWVQDSAGVRTETEPGQGSAEPEVSVHVQTEAQLEAVLEHGSVRRVYVDCQLLPRLWENPRMPGIVKRIRERGKEAWLVLPYIFREKTRKRYDASWTEIEQAGWDGMLVRNYESFCFLKDRRFAKPVRTDYNLYQFNREAKAFWREKGAAGMTAPLELTAGEMKGLGLADSEAVVYGHLPMMVSAGCIHKTMGTCRKQSGQTGITDRYKKKFLVKNYCDDCYNVIYNPEPLYLADIFEEVGKLRPEGVRLMFTVEDREETARVLRLYEEAWQGRGEASPLEFTRGHFRKGIK